MLGWRNSKYEMCRLSGSSEIWTINGNKMQKSRNHFRSLCLFVSFHKIWIAFMTPVTAVSVSYKHITTYWRCLLTLLYLLIRHLLPRLLFYRIYIAKECLLTLRVSSNLLIWFLILEFVNHWIRIFMCWICIWTVFGFWILDKRRALIDLCCFEFGQTSNRYWS